MAKRSTDIYNDTYSELYRKWLRKHLCIEGLVEIAREFVPQKQPYYVFPYGRVSHVYKLPVRDEDGNLGYGEPGETLEAIKKRIYDDERTQKLFDEKGWVPIDDEL